jgi:hypothetical protein
MAERSTHKQGKTLQAEHSPLNERPERPERPFPCDPILSSVSTWQLSMCFCYEIFHISFLLFPIFLPWNLKMETADGEVPLRLFHSKNTLLFYFPGGAEHSPLNERPERPERPFPCDPILWERALRALGAFV